MIKRLFPLIMLLLVGIAFPAGAGGQVNLGAIKGETQDAQRAAVPDVKISLRNEATGVVQMVRSDASGDFSNCRLNWLRALTFNFERLDIFRDSIRHPSKKLLSFELAQRFNIQFRASRYMTELNQTSE